MTTDNFCFYLQNRLIQISQTGGQWYSDTSPFSIPWPNTLAYFVAVTVTEKKKFLLIGCMLASMIFRKEPFFHGHDNYDQVSVSGGLYVGENWRESDCKNARPNAQNNHCKMPS
jgi:hypothetical protein